MKACFRPGVVACATAVACATIAFGACGGGEHASPLSTDASADVSMMNEGGLDSCTRSLPSGTCRAGDSCGPFSSGSACPACGQNVCPCSGLDFDCYVCEDGGFVRAPVCGGTGPQPPTCEAGTSWACAVDHSCSTPTTLTGKVFDPAGRVPLANVTVFIPENVTTLPAILAGTSSCPTCPEGIGHYVSASLTDASGKFTLNEVPTGTSVPVTVQIGKWRRTTLVSTKGCQVNMVSTLPTSSPLLRLPANAREGDLPAMALLSGGCDGMACLLGKMGIAPSEFGSPQSGAHVAVYKGLGASGSGPGLTVGSAGDCTGQACALWSTKQDLEHYDIVLLGCECGEHNETKPPAARQAMHDWLSEGGRVWATHYQSTWFKNGPADFQGVANWLPSPTDGPTPGPFSIDTTWVLGQSLETWLNFGGDLNPDRTLPLVPADVSTSVSSVNMPSRRWVFDTVPSGADSGSTGDTKVLTINTPVGGIPADAGEGLTYCGEALFSDIHPGGTGLPGDASVPASCTGGVLTPEEKALEYLFFQWSSPCNLPPPQINGGP